jgi:hypothetical protein
MSAYQYVSCAMYDLCLTCMTSAYLYDVCLPVLCLSTCIMCAQLNDVCLQLCSASCTYDIRLPVKYNSLQGSVQCLDTLYYVGLSV